MTASTKHMEGYNMTPNNPILKSLITADYLQSQKTSNYIVKNWLYKNTIAMIYGASNTGKTFLTLDLCKAITEGNSWNSYRTKDQESILYIPLEGTQAIANRIEALKLSPTAQTKFMLLDQKLDIMKPETATNIINLFTDETEIAPPTLIVVDTLHRAMNGADENSHADISRLINNLEIIKNKLKCCILLIHHTGKDQERGARGSSSLKAAIDTEISLTHADGISTACITKARDGQTGIKFNYKLNQVALGYDEDNDPITTCTIEECDPPKNNKKERLNDTSKILLQGIKDAVFDAKSNYTDRETAKDCAIKKGLAVSTQQERTALSRAWTALISKKYIQEYEGRIYLND